MENITNNTVQGPFFILWHFFTYSGEESAVYIETVTILAQALFDVKSLMYFISLHLYIKKVPPSALSADGGTFHSL